MDNLCGRSVVVSHCVMDQTARRLFALVEFHQVQQLQCSNTGIVSLVHPPILSDVSASGVLQAVPLMRTTVVLHGERAETPFSPSSDTHMCRAHRPQYPAFGALSWRLLFPFCSSFSSCFFGEALSRPTVTAASLLSVSLFADVCTPEPVHRTSGYRLTQEIVESMVFRP